MTMFRTTALAAALGLIAGPLAAEPGVGLAGDRTLVMFDTDTGMVTGMMTAEGVDRLLGIDLRPATGQLIGVTADHAIVEIDPATGATTEISRMQTMLPLMDGQPVIVDFNPAADRLRFMTGTTNHRVNVDTGEVIVDGSLAWAEGDANAGTAPMIGAAAYINSYGRPDGTAMFNIDTALSAFVQQTAPNDGTLATIGALGVTLDGPVGLDVATTAMGDNTVWIAAMGGIHTIDLTTGMVTESWMLEGLDDVVLRDITILTAM